MAKITNVNQNQNNAQVEAQKQAAALNLQAKEAVKARPVDVNSGTKVAQVKGAEAAKVGETVNLVSLIEENTTSNVTAKAASADKTNE